MRSTHGSAIDGAPRTPLDGSPAFVDSDVLIASATERGFVEREVLPSVARKAPDTIDLEGLIAAVEQPQPASG